MHEAVCRQCGNGYLALAGARSGLCCNCRGRKRRQYKSVARAEPPGYINSVQALHAYFDRPALDCLICGWIGPGLYRHIVLEHGISAPEYKREFGIPMSYGLIGSVGRAALARQAVRRTRQTLAKGKRPPTRVAWPRYLALEHAAKMVASPNHPSNSIGLADTVCRDCGDLFQMSAKVVLAKQCVALCASCKRRRRRERA